MSCRSPRRTRVRRPVAGLPLTGLPAAGLLAAFAFAAVVSQAVWRPAPAAAQQRSGQIELPDTFRTYPSPYYTIHTDLPPDRVREIALRMTRMAEEYHARTAGFSGVIRRQLPFYVFERPEDYYAAGGMPGSVGVFMSRGRANAADSDSRLMAIAVDRVLEKLARNTKEKVGQARGGDDEPDVSAADETWHVIQHEGFHQFAHAVIGGDLPTWVNEGLAEYFGESQFTGDGFVTGVIPPRRLERVRKKMKDGKFRSVKEIMLMSHQEWNADLNGNNYDQAWSMVQFLAHGEGGAYQQAFTAFMQALGRGQPWVAAWQAAFGSAEGFEKRWRDWWLALPEDPTADLYTQAAVSTFTSFLARATVQKQTFADFDAFLKAAKAHELKAGNDDWLPPALLDKAVRRVESRDDQDVQWSLEFDPAKTPRVVAALKDGTRIVGTFTRSGARVGKVLIDIDDLPVVIAKAKALAAANKKKDAQAMLKAAIARHPKSPLADEARKTLAGMK